MEHDADIFDLCVLLKEALQPVVGGEEGQIPHKDVVIFQSPITAQILKINLN